MLLEDIFAGPDAAASSAAGGEITCTQENIGQERRIVRQTYRVQGIAGLDAVLKILDYGDDPGRVVQSIEIWPEAYQGRGYAQALYLAALRDGPLDERPKFQSREAARAIERMIAKGLVARRDGQLRRL